MKKIKHIANLMLVIVVFQILFTSCCNYYKAISTPVKNKVDVASKLDSLKQANRTFILRDGQNAFYMSNPVLSSDQNTMDCTLEPLESFNKLHLTNGLNGKMR